MWTEKICGQPTAHADATKQDKRGQPAAVCPLLGHDTFRLNSGDRDHRVVDPQPQGMRR
jgi:hypothetical protein